MFLAEASAPFDSSPYVSMNRARRSSRSSSSRYPRHSRCSTCDTSWPSAWVGFCCGCWTFEWFWFWVSISIISCSKSRGRVVDWGAADCVALADVGSPDSAPAPPTRSRWMYILTTTSVITNKTLFQRSSQSCTYINISGMYHTIQEHLVLPQSPWCCTDHSSENVRTCRGEGA